uniref:Uncharacterized protein n=1 Tax=Arundo donax TaxID=35708 RepID=A0A0A9ABV7_ARUDO
MHLLMVNLYNHKQIDGQSLETFGWHKLHRDILMCYREQLSEIISCFYTEMEAWYTSDVI